MRDELVVIHIPLAALLLAWLGIKLAAAVPLQYCFVKTRTPRIDVWSELKELCGHFGFSFLFYPEATLVWACVWPLFAVITWQWHPKYILPGTVIRYLEKRNVRVDK